ncbi:hypothetical protein COV22_02995 [Candidatus Woesearchaeota archaeon CG10_big_fil_rev_8_21_14_0_10_47_5]|nr:MAG: hypothetical protein COV22_02995 [Candidatus Woesearchaeota archaeon CG10_big_fil_rev_8_21_14_0_10_47_5]
MKKTKEILWLGIDTDLFNRAPIIARNARITAIVGNSPHEPGTCRKDNGIMTVRISGLPFLPSLSQGIFAAIFAIKNIREINAVVTDYFGFIGALIIKEFHRNKPPIFLNILSPPVCVHGIKGVLIHLYFKLVLVLSNRFAKQVFVLSENTKDIVALFFRDKDKITVTGLGINPAFITKPNKTQDMAIKAELGIKNDETVLIYHGTLAPDRGLEEMLHAFAIASSTLKDQDLKLIIVGDGGLRRKLKSLNTHLNLDNQVFFCGWKSYEALPAYIEAADIAIVPMPENRNWSISYKLLEYLAMGKPTIATDIEVNRLVDRGRGLVYFVKPERKSMAEAILHIANNPELRKEMSRRATIVREEFDWRKSASRMTEAITRAVKG